MTNDPHPWAANLTSLQTQVWSMLVRGVGDRHASARHLTLATVSPEGWPEARTIMLRAAHPEAATLDIHTDLRSWKLIRGIARVADRTRVDENASRHGDAAIAAALAYAASRADPVEYAYEAVPAEPPGRDRWRVRADHREDDYRAPGSGILPDLRGGMFG